MSEPNPPTNLAPLELYNFLALKLNSTGSFFSCLVRKLRQEQLTRFFGSNNMTWSPRLSFLGTNLLNTQISRLPLINTEDMSQLYGKFLTNFRGDHLQNH